MTMHTCTHPRSELRWRNRAAGLIGRQCLDCGGNAAGTGWVKHSDVPDLAALADWAALPDAASDPERVGLAGPMDRATHPRYVDLEEYGRYLASDIWKRRRDKVLARAAGTCEGCLSGVATEVHHLTYRHVFAEFAFELVALCVACHRRIHAASPPGEVTQE